MYRIVQINHTNIHFIQNSQRFLFIITNYRIVIIVTKNLQKNYKIVTNPIAGIGRRPKIPSYLCPICIYTYKGATKGAASGAALGSCIEAALPLRELRFAAAELQKFRLQKFHIFSF